MLKSNKKLTLKLLPKKQKNCIFRLKRMPLMDQQTLMLLGFTEELYYLRVNLKDSSSLSKDLPMIMKLALLMRSFNMLAEKEE